MKEGKSFCSDKVFNLPHNNRLTPMVSAFVDAQGWDAIFFCHSPRHCPNDLTQATSFDNHMVAVMGNDIAQTIPVALAGTVLPRALNVLCLHCPQVTGQCVAAPWCSINALAIA